MIELTCFIIGYFSLIAMELIFIDHLMKRNRKGEDNDRVRDLGARPRVWEQD
jgi:hypothetical protein